MITCITKEDKIRLESSLRLGVFTLRCTQNTPHLIWQALENLGLHVQNEIFKISYEFTGIYLSSLPVVCKQRNFSVNTFTFDIKLIVVEGK